MTGKSNGLAAAATTDEAHSQKVSEPTTTNPAGQKSQSWRDTVRVHPAADLFPMMSEDELRELGEDIKAHGLTTPIVIWGERDDENPRAFLLDGRNRLDAMEAVGISFVLNTDGVDCTFTSADLPQRLPKLVELWDGEDPYD